jgi:hypothetical protein
MRARAGREAVGVRSSGSPRPSRYPPAIEEAEQAGTEEEVMRRHMLVAAFAALAALIVSRAWADNPHFDFASAAFDSGFSLVTPEAKTLASASLDLAPPGPPGSNLIVSFREVGLGNTERVDYAAGAQGTAVYACINGGDKHPRATNKTIVTSLVGTSGSLTATGNGNIDGSLLLPPAGPGTLSCPRGHSLVLVEVSFTNVAIADTTNSVSQGIPGTFKKTLVNLP